MSKPQISILMVEDDIVDRMACRRTLALNEYDCDFVLYEAETAQEGLQLCQTQKPDCVLLDYNLPDLSGLEFLVALKADQGGEMVPVIMLTGTDNASVAVEAIKCGAYDYLVKDSNLQYLDLLPSVIQRLFRERLLAIEKKQKESYLANATAKYRILLEQIPAITYTAALEKPGKLLYVSPQISVLGYSPEEWIAPESEWLNRIHADDRIRAMEAFNSVRVTGKPLRCEYRLIDRAGEVRWVLDEARLVRDESGNPLLLQGILIDITKNKQVEEELRQHRRHVDELVALRTSQFEKQTAIFKSANANLSSELRALGQSGEKLKKYANQLGDLYNNAPCGYHSLDVDGMFAQINDTELQWLGYTREELVGRVKLIDVLTANSMNFFLDHYQKFKETGWLCNVELEFIRKDGTTLPVLLCANGVKDQGHFVMSRSIIVDISDFKRANKQL